ncbi:Ankyrin repeat domain-containing protein 1 [Durusdinium trenchii]|uniref:Ankyrin repeat domain-containing protein 1 n=1 Tax=Durusdinium trenchii TaxID=1381693 RepID=A0ABP0R1K9_9DINO
MYLLVWSNDLCGETVQRSTKKVGELRQCQRSGRSALHRAAFNGEIDEVERLLRAGLDIEAKDNRVDTPLHLAAGYGHLTVVDRLIAAGAVLEATGRFGATPLHWAAVAGHWEVAQRLIEARADLEAKDHSGRTPLHRAAEECYWEVAQRLIEARADLKVRDKQGQTPWHFAKKNGWKKMIGVLHPVWSIGNCRGPSRQAEEWSHCDLKDRRTVHGLQEDFQQLGNELVDKYRWRATELLKKKTEELYVLIPKMVDLFEGIDDTKMERLAEQLVEMMEVSTDVLLTKSMKHYGQLRLQCIKLQGDAFEFHFLMTSFENCLQGQKIRVSDDEFRDMMDLVHLDQLLAQVKKHQERRQVVEDELESSAEDAYSEVDEVSDIEKNEQGAGVPQVICLAMLAIGL